MQSIFFKKVCTYQTHTLFTVESYSVLFAVFSFVIPDDEKIDWDTAAMRNILLLVVFIQLFTSINMWVMRMNYYFILFIPALIPKIIRAAKPQYRQLAFWGELVLVVFFTAYFFYGAYFGGDGLEIFPYVPFWAET